MTATVRRAKVWLVYFQHWQGRLSLDVVREVCSYLAEDPQLVSVTPAFLRFFNCWTYSWGPTIPLRSPIQANKHSSWLVLKDERLFCSGGGEQGKYQVGDPGWPEAYLLCGDGAVDPLPNMLSARIFHAVIQVLHIYVFGGDNLAPAGMCYSARKCEKLDLTYRNNTWTALPEMREGRSSFNPCLFNGVVYLCGFGSLLVEAFAPHTDSFLPLQLHLPDIHSHLCLYVQNNVLVAHSNTHITKFEVGQAGQLVQYSQVSSPISVSKWGNTHPVLDPTRGLFFLFQKNKCLCFHMETGAKIQDFT